MPKHFELWQAGGQINLRGGKKHAGPLSGRRCFRQAGSVFSEIQKPR